MIFPNTIEEYFKDYAFIDEEQIYTNGSELIPTFRVKQWEEHKDKEIERLNNIIYQLRYWIVNNKHNENTKEHYLVVDYGKLLNKLQELEGSDKE
jgi:hypothetical protein